MFAPRSWKDRQWLAPAATSSVSATHEEVSCLQLDDEIVAPLTRSRTH